MKILIFFLVLSVLVFIHELGHFLFAKLFKVKVPEFGFGYPPRLAKLGRWRGTDITLNWVPFGGFVKLFGESDDGNELSPEDKKVSLVYKPRWQQLLVMFGGILFNVILGWMLLSISYTSGVPTAVSGAPDGYQFESTELTITAVLPESPASASGLQPGDVILEYGTPSESVIVTDEKLFDFSTFVNNAGIQDEDVYLVVQRGSSLETTTVEPETGIVPDSFGIGIGLNRIGELKLPPLEALTHGAKSSVAFLGEIASGFWSLISGKVSLNAVSGPVGIVGQVGQAATLGFSYVIAFTAILSLNLAILNFIPFPALDGGRIFILLIESVIQRRINPKVVNWINVGGFSLLILFMIIITINDILKLF